MAASSESVETTSGTTPVNSRTSLALSRPMHTSVCTFARAKVHTLVCMGLDNAKLVREFTGVVPEVVSTDSLEAAMTASKAAARPGDAVLLSPACASFDLFRNYENRGELFKNWVEEKA